MRVTDDEAKSRDGATEVGHPQAVVGGGDRDRLKRVESDRLAEDPVVVRVDLPHRGGVPDRLKECRGARPGYESTQTWPAPSAMATARGTAMLAIARPLLGASRVRVPFATDHSEP